LKAGLASATSSGGLANLVKGGVIPWWLGKSFWPCHTSYRGIDNESSLLTLHGGFRRGTASLRIGLSTPLILAEISAQSTLTA